MDISKLTTKELQTLLKRVAKEIDKRKQQERYLTWTSRGRKPHWVTKWLDEGKTMEALAV